MRCDVRVTVACAIDVALAVTVRNYAHRTWGGRGCIRERAGPSFFLIWKPHDACQGGERAEPVGNPRTRGRGASAWEARKAAGLHVATPLSRGAGVSRAPGEPGRAEHWTRAGKPRTTCAGFPRAERFTRYDLDARRILHQQRMMDRPVLHQRGALVFPLLPMDHCCLFFGGPCCSPSARAIPRG